MKKITLILGIFVCSITNGQTVESFVDNGSFTMNHGCAVSAEEVVYSTDIFGNGNYNGQYVYKTLANGTTTVFASGFNGAAGLTLDASGNLFVSELNTGRIWKILLNGTKSIFASGTGVPAGMAFDSSGNLYVANFQFREIKKITPSGSVSTFAFVNSEPTGIIIDKDNNLFVSHETPHIISKITPSGNVSVFADIPGTKLQYLTFFGEDILVTGYTDHKIYRVNPQGSWSVYSGNGTKGSNDGSLDQSTFNAPTGIGVASNSSITNIYIVEKNRIRKIMTPTLSVDDEIGVKNLISIRSNQNIVTVSFGRERTGELVIYDITGKIIKTQKINKKSKIEIISRNMSKGNIYLYHWVSSDISGRQGGKFYLK